MVSTLFLACSNLEAMGSSMVDVMLGVRIPQVNDQDQIVQLGNYCSSSFWVAFINEIKVQPSKNYTMTLTQTTYPNRIVLHTGKNETRSAEVGVLAPVFKKSAT